MGTIEGILLGYIVGIGDGTMDGSAVGWSVGILTETMWVMLSA